MVPKVEAVEELTRRYSDDVDKVLPEAGALEMARSYREKKAKLLYKKIVGVLRAIREREDEQKRQRRMFRHSRNIGVR